MNIILVMFGNCGKQIYGAAMLSQEWDIDVRPFADMVFFASIREENNDVLTEMIEGINGGEQNDET